MSTKTGNICFIRIDRSMENAGFECLHDGTAECCADHGTGHGRQYLAFTQKVPGISTKKSMA